MSRRSPFTIIELLTVITIISILTGLILGIASFASTKAHTSKTLAKLTALEDAVGQFKGDRGYFPSTTGYSPNTDGTIQLGDYRKTDSGFDFNSIEEHTASDSPPGSSPIPATHPLRENYFVNSQTGAAYIGGYKGGKYLDAWGHPFLYRCDGSGNQRNTQSFDIWSAGPDGKVDTDDDITNWTRNN